MPSANDDLTDYEVCFTVSPDSGTKQITRIGPDRIFHGMKSEDIVLKVKAGDDEEAEQKAFQTLSDPAGPYVKKFGPGFEVKKKYVWRIMYM